MVFPAVLGIGIVFMVDTTDTERFLEAKEELMKLLSSDELSKVDFLSQLLLYRCVIFFSFELSKVPFLILGNKIDAKNACSEDQLKRILGVEYTTGKKLGSVEAGVRPLEVFMCSVVKRAGYADGFRWLASFI